MLIDAGTLPFRTRTTRADRLREQARPGLMPSAQDYTTIGHLYDAIRANLAALDRQLGQEAVFLGDAGSQVGPAVIDLEGVQPITCLADANHAIDVVVEPGEGSSANSDESHYRSFIAIRDELEQLTSADPQFVLAWPVADSPVLRRPADPHNKVFVDHPDAARMLDFACATYGLLLRCLVQSFGREGPNREAAQKALVSAAIDLMHVLGDASTRLARLPASPDLEGVHAGMSFTMLRGVEPLLLGRVERRLLDERAAALSRADADIGSHARTALSRAAATLSRV